MFGLDNNPSINEKCERCRCVYPVGSLKHFVSFTDCLFYQNYSTVYGCEVCYKCLLFINGPLSNAKKDMATITGLSGFLVAYENQSSAVHVTLLIRAEGKYMPQFSNEMRVQ